MQASTVMSNSAILDLSDGTTSNYVRMLYNQPLQRFETTAYASSSRILDTTGAFQASGAANTPFTFAIALSPTSVALAANGTTSATVATTGTVPTASLFTFGGTTGGNQINGWLDSVFYCPVTRSLSDLLELTR